MNPTLGRPVAASLIFLAVAVLAVLALAASWADLAGATAERDAKAEAVSRRMPVRSGAANPDGTAKQSLYVEADSETLAAARMDALVRATVIEAGGSVSSTRAETKAEEGSGSERLEIQASIEASNDALQTVLTNLENGTPMALVDMLTVEPVDVSETGVGPPGPANLRATMTLSAYWAKPKP